MVMPCQDLSHGWHQGLRLVVRANTTLSSVLANEQLAGTVAFAEKERVQ